MPQRPQQKIDLSKLPLITIAAKHHLKALPDQWAARLLEAKLPPDEKLLFHVVAPRAVCAELDKWASDVDHKVPCLIIHGQEGTPCEIVRIIWAREKPFGQIIFKHNAEFAGEF
jgi:hypothetical protein